MPHFSLIPVRTRILGLNSFLIGEKHALFSIFLVISQFSTHSNHGLELTQFFLKLGNKLYKKKINFRHLLVPFREYDFPSVKKVLY